MVARDRNGAIGKKNSLPWHLSDDLKLFKRNTLHHTILMGRKTYDSIGKALPNRKNLVLSHNQELKLNDAVVLHSIEETLDYCNEKKCDQLIIIGGGSIFSNFLPLAQLLYITEVDTIVNDADVFFSEVDLQSYDRIFTQPFEKNENNDHNFIFNLYKKK